MSCPINKCGFSAQEKGCGKARSAGNTLPYCQGTQRGHSPSPARPSGVGTIAEGCVAALGNMPDIPCGLRLALGDCAHSESHLFMGQDTRRERPNSALNFFWIATERCDDVGMHTALRVPRDAFATFLGTADDRDFIDQRIA